LRKQSAKISVIGGHVSIVARWVRLEMFFGGCGVEDEISDDIGNRTPFEEITDYL
jgi:hypothetical protein